MKYMGFLSIFIICLSHAYAESQEEYTNKFWKLTHTETKYLNEHKILAISKVSSKNEQQSFKLKAMAKHPKKCTKVLRRLSQLENFKDWISFIKESTYQDENKLFTLRAEHTLLPFPMIIHILVDRPTKIGKYPFTFPTGMFKGLKGHFEIKEFEGQCLFYATSFWNGKKTKIPDVGIEIFSETLTKIGGEILMRKLR